jgi:hypothetical protein
MEIKAGQIMPTDSTDESLAKAPEMSQVPVPSEGDMIQAATVEDAPQAAGPTSAVVDTRAPVDVPLYPAVEVSLTLRQTILGS